MPFDVRRLPPWWTDLSALAAAGAVHLSVPDDSARRRGGPAPWSPRDLLESGIRVTDRRALLTFDR